MKNRAQKIPAFGRSVQNRRGVIFIVALGIIVILTGLVLAFAQSMRTEASASANRLSYAQADAVEQGAEMWVLGMCESYPGDAITITQTPAEAIQVGSPGSGGWFWILHPDPTQDQTYTFGITDEAGKLNLNPPTTADQIINLPSMTQDVADNIQAWAGPPNSDPNGAQSDYYQSLSEPYQAKNAPFETVEELFLVENVTAQLLYGEDLNHDGVIEQAEQNVGGGLTLTTGDSAGTPDTRGMFNYVTVYSIDPAGGANLSGTQRVNVNSQNFTQLQQTLATALSGGSSRASQIIAQLQSRMPRGNAPPNWDMGTFYNASGMTPTEFGQVFDDLTAARAPQPGLINVNTAPTQVLMCIPGLQPSDADTIVANRSSADTSNLSWFFSAISSSEITAVAPHITDRSYQYSADIVAVSADGRAFKRVRIVVDATQTPAKIVYRKDLTSLGWPLDPQIRIDMRLGQQPPDAEMVGNNPGSNATQ